MVEFQVIFTFIFEYLNIFLVYTNDNNETNTFQKMLFFFPNGVKQSHEL